MYIEAVPVAGQRQVDVVVVNWNSGVQLRDCIESLVKHGQACIQKIVVIDNGSVDGSEGVAEEMDAVQLVRTARNLGFAKACNLGVTQCAADYVLLLNPDTRVFDDSLTAPLAFMDKPGNERVGIVGIQNIGQDESVQRTCARFPRPRSFVVHSLGLNALWPRHFQDHMMREWLHNEDRQVDHVIGSYFLVRRQLWDLLGGLDERFFIYFEDLDFSLRAHRLGWVTWYLAGPKIFHRGGGTSEQIKARRLFYSLRSRLHYAAKHFGPVDFIAVSLAALLIEPIARIALASARREWTVVAETLRGYAVLYGAVPDIVRQVRGGG